MSYNSTQESLPLLMLQQQQKQKQQQQQTYRSNSNIPHETHIPIQKNSIDQVRTAFQERDVLTTIQLHNARLQNATLLLGDEAHASHQDNNQQIGRITATIQAILIALTTVFTGIAANIAFVLLVALLAAHAIATGFGNASNNALSAASERIFIDSEVARERWELEVNLSGEVEEMVALYTEQGVSYDDAMTIWTTYSKYPNIFLDAMLSAECGIIRPTGVLNTRKLASDQFFAFLFGSLIPFIPMMFFHLLSRWVSFEDNTLSLLVTLLISLMSLFYFGTKRSQIFPFPSDATMSTYNVMTFSDGIQTIIIGVICAGVGFSIGKISAMLA